MVTNFGRMLRMLRVANGRLLKHDADELGVSSAELSGWENGRSQPPIEAIRKLAEIHTGKPVTTAGNVRWNHLLGCK